MPIIADAPPATKAAPLESFKSAKERHEQAIVKHIKNINEAVEVKSDVISQMVVAQQYNGQILKIALQADAAMEGFDKQIKALHEDKSGYKVYQESCLGKRRFFSG